MNLRCAIVSGFFKGSKINMFKRMNKYLRNSADKDKGRAGFYVVRA
jgi:hypothetical protein